MYLEKDLIAAFRKNNRSCWWVWFTSSSTEMELLLQQSGFECRTGRLSQKQAHPGIWLIDLGALSRCKPLPGTLRGNHKGFAWQIRQSHHYSERQTSMVLQS